MLGPINCFEIPPIMQSNNSHRLLMTQVVEKAFPFSLLLRRLLESKRIHQLITSNHFAKFLSKLISLPNLVQIPFVISLIPIEAISKPIDNSNQAEIRGPKVSTHSTRKISLSPVKAQIWPKETIKLSTLQRVGPPFTLGLPCKNSNPPAEDLNLPSQNIDRWIHAVVVQLVP